MSGQHEPVRRYEFDDGSSRKFWEISLAGDSHTVTFGRLGTNGQTQTKTFDDAAAARKSYDKLVAEKTKKGYVLVAGASTTAAAPTATAPSTSAPAPAAKPAAKTKAPGAKPAKDSATTPASAVATEPDDDAAPATTASPAPNVRPGVVLEVTDRMALDPTDWFWAAWRDPDPLPRPDPPKFDLEDRLRRIGNVRTRYRDWPWASLIRSVSLTREEAHFWFVAMTEWRSNMHPTELVGLLRLVQFDGVIDGDEIQRRMERQQHTDRADEFALVLATLLPLEELYDLIVGDWNLMCCDGKPDEDNPHAAWAAWMFVGLQRYVVPYLTRSERCRLLGHFAAHLRPPTSIEDYWTDACWMPWCLAVVLGDVGAANSVLAAWGDDGVLHEHWRANPQFQTMIPLLNLGDPDRTISESRRRRLLLGEVYHRWSDSALPGTKIRAWLASTGTRALDLVADTIRPLTNKDEAETHCTAFACVEAPEAAPYMLDLAKNSKATRVAREWLDTFVGNAVHGLVASFGRAGQTDAAVQYLRDAKAKGHGAIVEAAARKVGGEIEARIRQLVLEHEEKSYPALDDATTPEWLAAAVQGAGRKKATLPTWADPATLPPILLGEFRLNDAQTAAVLSVLASAELGDAAPLLAGLREHARRPALEAFAWRLFELWQEDGAPAKQKWAMRALGHLGGDGIALRLAPLVRAWPGESQHQRAVFGLECLRSIGSDTALMQLDGIAQKVKFQGLKKRARECMEEIAAAKGLTREQLEDRIVPDFDLDGRGRRTFDFGPRKFEFVLGPDLKPCVKDEAGKIRDDLPKPGKGDDPVRAPDAVEAWKVLKKQLREALKIQAPRLEQAMVKGRRWSVADFETLLVRHPLMTHLARTLLWGGWDAGGKLVRTFRVTDEQDYAGIDDEAATLDGLDSVGLVHPLRLAPEDARRWGELFGDYEIVPPFPQLDRPVYKLEPGEETDTTFRRLPQGKIEAVVLLGILDRRGWVRGVPMDGGMYCEHSKQFPGANVTAVLVYEDGIPIGYLEGADDQELTSCFFVPGLRAPDSYGEHDTEIPLGQVDVVAVGEVLADLALLAHKVV